MIIFELWICRNKCVFENFQGTRKALIVKVANWSWDINSLIKLKAMINFKGSLILNNLRIPETKVVFKKPFIVKKNHLPVRGDLNLNIDGAYFGNPGGQAVVV